MRVNKHTATLFTFFLSALVHELVMWCIFKKLRGYLLFMQMLQLPVCAQVLPFPYSTLTLPIGGLLQGLSANLI